MKCPMCGADNPEYSVYCGVCAAELPEITNRASYDTQSKPGDKACPDCGAWNPKDKRFCGDCGTALAEDSYLQNGSKSEDPPFYSCMRLDWTLRAAMMAAAGTIMGPILFSLGEYGFGALILLLGIGGWIWLAFMLRS